MPTRRSPGAKARDCEDDGDIGEQRQRQPLQDPHRPLVREQHLRGDAECAEAEHVERLGPADEKLDRLGHRGDVGGDVDRVRDDEQTDQSQRQPARADLVDVGSQALAGRPTDPRREHLDADHQRRRQEQRPDEAEAELGAGLRVGRDAARVVVGGAGDETRAEPARETLQALVGGRLVGPLCRGGWGNVGRRPDAGFAARVVVGLRPLPFLIAACSSAAKAARRRDFLPSPRAGGTGAPTGRRPSPRRRPRRRA